MADRKALLREVAERIQNADPESLAYALRWNGLPPVMSKSELLTLLQRSSLPKIEGVCKALRPFVAEAPAAFGWIGWVDGCPRWEPAGTYLAFVEASQQKDFEPTWWKEYQEFAGQEVVWQDPS